MRRGCVVSNVTNAEVLKVGLNDTDRVGVAHATLPALDNDNGVAFAHHVQVDGVGETPLDTAVDVLLPVLQQDISVTVHERRTVSVYKSRSSTYHLGEIRLGLVKQERVDTAVLICNVRCIPPIYQPCGLPDEPVARLSRSG
jgi:hypothetical protein